MNQLQGWYLSGDSPQPMAFAGVCVAADGVVLVSQPDDEDDVEGGGRVVEELRHNGLHTYTQDVTSSHNKTSDLISCPGLIVLRKWSYQQGPG